ncbi:MAG: SAM-dependent methyltransferase, partial [Acidobacteriota bacterium]
AGILRRIQNTCFSEYPPEMVRRMSRTDGPLPEEIPRDPARRQKFLKTEETVERGLFYPSLLEDLLPSFEAILRPGARFLDLGSGDGRVVFLAALLGADATGIEYDRRLHRIARRSRARLEEILDTDRAVLRRGDFFDEDLGRYDVLFYFARGSFGEDRLLEKIRDEMRPDATLLISFPSGPPSGLSLIARYGDVHAYRLARP